MAWNEPGNNGNGNDPWGGGRRGGDQGPPDIDEVIKNLSKKVNGLFGSGSGGSSGGGGSQAPGNMSAGLLVGLVAVAAIIWGFMGFYVVDEAERGVVLRFGKVLDATVAPGLHWNPPIVDEVNLVNVSELNAKTYENRAMLTTDENIIDIDVTVQYVIQDPVNYVIAVQDPERSLDNAAESAIRHEVGSNFMDQILTTGREQMAAAVQDRLQERLGVAAGERQVSGDRLEDRHAERVEVARRRQLAAERLLGRRVVQRPEEAAALGRQLHRRVVERLCEAEVGQRERAVVGDQDVARLDVPVQQTPPVREPQRVGDAGEAARRVDRLQRCLLEPSRRAHVLVEAHAVDALHREEQHPRGLTVVVDRHDVAVVQRRGRARLGAEALAHRRIGRVVARQRAAHAKRR